MLLIKLTIFIVLGVDKVISNDPCNDAVELHSPGKRGGKCIIPKSSKQICDRYIMEGWYKVQHEDDAVPREMVDKCLQINSGGTLFPAWLNGTHPTNLNDVVNRTVCQSGASTCCDVKIDIQVKKCSRYFVYRLSPLKECKSAYSFGEKMECAIDPCDDETYKILSDNGDRSAHCHRKYNQLCDDHLPNQWQRVTRNGADLQMPTTCVEAIHCATERPIWLKGRPPTIDEKTSKREVCVSGKLSCCEKSYDIYIRNCSSFLVYNLTTPKECPERYCFGNSALCDADDNDKDDKEICDWLCILSIILSILVLTAIGIAFVIWLILKNHCCQRKVSNETVNPNKDGKVVIQTQVPDQGLPGKEGSKQDSLSIRLLKIREAI